MSKFKFLVTALCVFTGLCYVNPAYAGTIPAGTTVSATFNFDNDVPDTDAPFADENNGIMMLTGGALSVCGEVGDGPAGFANNFVATASCGSAYSGASYFIFSHPVDTLSFDYLTSGAGLIEIAAGTFDSDGPSYDAYIGDLAGPAGGSLTFSGNGPIYFVIFDFMTFEDDPSAGSPDYAIDNVAVTATITPEPSSIFLLGTGMLGLAGGVHRRFKA